VLQSVLTAELQQLTVENRALLDRVKVLESQQHSASDTQASVAAAGHMKEIGDCHLI